MRQYILKRLLLAVPTLIGVSLIVFFMVRLIPGDIVEQIAGDYAADTGVPRAGRERAGARQAGDRAVLRLARRHPHARLRHVAAFRTSR